MADIFKQTSSIRIYGCPHDVVFCGPCRKRQHLNRRARRSMRMILQKTMDEPLRQPRNHKTGPHAGLPHWFLK
jgi:hypothetical protein